MGILIWLVALLAFLLAAAASVTTLRIEWEGVATRHHYGLWDDSGTWLGNVTEEIDIPVRGLFEVGLHLLRHGDPPASPASRTSRVWAR